jgi:hypothetical protein
VCVLLRRCASQLGKELNSTNHPTHNTLQKQQLDVPARTAHVRYPETDEEEDLDLAELIAERSIAVRECCWLLV